MTVQLLSHPFRLNKRGEAVTLDDMSVEYCAERLGIILGTQPGERVMIPTFGVNDPAFEGFTSQALRVQISQYGLPVEVGEIKRAYLNDSQERVTIQFDIITDYYGGINGRS